VLQIEETEKEGNEKEVQKIKEKKRKVETL